MVESQVRCVNGGKGCREWIEDRMDGDWNLGKEVRSCLGVAFPYGDTVQDNVNVNVAFFASM